MDKNPAIFLLQATHSKMVSNQSGFFTDPWGVIGLTVRYKTSHLECCEGRDMPTSEGAAQVEAKFSLRC
jgi:hypothetical protein